MGKPPAVIIIARHGARLDQADRSWHLTSPTPYDPPLTYGGWTQSRALGARIASLLQSREESPHHEANKTNGAEGHEEPKHPRRPRKHKVFIHSSPFLRCLQTSIAISAGMGQFYKASHQQDHVQKHHLHSGSPHLHGLDTNSPHLSAIPEPDDEPAQQLHKKHHQASLFTKNHLRVDAFLGEWLSPDYFENITPPPGSTLMVAGAKTELLRRGNPVEDAGSRSLHGNFPGGWGSSGTSSVAESEDEVEEGGLAHMAHLGHSLPKRTRASTHDSLSNATARLHAKQTTKLNTNFPHEKPHYVPPTPSYAISPSNPIPAGYVSHARDACVEVEFQWDSMRAPLEWGNGGEYGEEWSAMHKRFRNGVQKMIYWYSEPEPSTNLKENFPSKNGSSTEHDSGSDEEDTVLILVTHGAGCNALIGALTAQPVLLDVGMASLTMAVRKDIIEPFGEGYPSDSVSSPVATSAPTLSQPRQRKSSIDNTIPSSYEVVLIASTEHLRAGSNPLAVPQLQSPRPSYSPSIASPLFTPNRRYGSASVASGTTFEGFSIGDPAHSPAIVRPPGSLHRSSSAAAASRQHTIHPTIIPSAKIAAGLWGSPTVASTAGSFSPQIDSVSETSSEDQLPNFGDGHSARGSITDTPPIPGTANATTAPQIPDRDIPRSIPVQDQKKRADTEIMPPPPNPASVGGTKGLWGGGAVQVVKDRENGVKRRWTVNEHH